MLETVFLSVLIVALALGNVFLSLTDPKRLLAARTRQNPGNGPGFENGPGLENGLAQSNILDEFREAGESSQAAESRGSFGQVGEGRDSFEQAADRERVRHLNKRIERLEQLLLKINNSKFVAQKINGTNLYSKLRDLNQFKQDTGLEIAAMRQRLDKIQPLEKASKPKLSEISDKKLRDLVFRASH